MSLAKKILRAYSKMDLPIKASMWAMLCSFVQKGIGFLTMPIFSRLLTTEEYGYYTVFYSWMNVLLVFCSLKIASGALNNGLLKYQNKKNEFMLSMTTLTLFLTILVMTIFLLGYDFFGKVVDLPFEMIPLMFVYIFFTSVVEIWSSGQRFEYKYRLLTLIAILIAFLSPVLGIIGVLSTVKYKAEVRIFSAVIVEIIIGIILCVLLLKKGSFKLMKIKYWRFALSFNLPLVPHYLSTMILMQCDTIMVSYFCGNAAVGLYGIAYSISMLSTIFNTSINSSLLPYTYHSIKEENIKKLKKIHNKLVIFVAFLNLLIILAVPEVLKVVAAPEYQEAVWVIPPLIGSVFLMFLYTILANVEFYYEKRFSIAIASLGAAFINILMNYVLIQKIGFVGAGYATLISYIMLTIFHIVNIKVIHRETIKDEMFDYKTILLISTVFVLFCCFAPMMYRFFILRIILVIIFSIIIFLKTKELINFKSKEK